MKKRRENKYNFVKLFLIVIPLNASDAATKKYHIVQEDIKFSNSKNIFENIPKLIGEGSFKIKNKITKFLYDITRLHKKNNHAPGHNKKEAHIVPLLDPAPTNCFTLYN